MGVDFLKSKAKAFTKGWDRARVDLARRSLFTRSPGEVVSGGVATTFGTSSLSPGDEVLLRTDGDRLVVVADLAVCAEFVKASDPIIQRVRECGGCAKARIGASHPSLNLVEVLLQ